MTHEPPPPLRIVRLPLKQLVGLALERFEALANPPSREPSPLLGGGTCEDWALFGGLMGDPPHEVIADCYTTPLECGENHPSNVAHRALQLLTLRSITERRGGLPMRYRPVRPRRGQ